MALKKVVDLTNSSQGFNDDATGTEISDTSDDYDYDLDGNMTKDENKDITLIKYNHLNLPTEIQFTNNRTINYTYDATGVKKQKQVFDGTYTTITDYIDGYQYENKHINIGGRGYTHLLFFPHAEGYVKPVYSENKTLTTRLFSYVYNHTDHLGNIRVSYAKAGGITEVLEENHYYPFGLKHQNYNDNKKKLSLKVSNNQKQVTSTVENPFKYKYNGKEYQDEFGLNWYDYGARNYDPAIARWMNTDPLAEVYNSHSPYNYGLNNPVFYVDLFGLGVEGVNNNNKITDWYRDGKGNIIFDKKIKSQKDLDDKGIDGTYIAPSFTGKNQDGNLFFFNEDGTITETGLTQTNLDDLEKAGLKIDALDIHTQEDPNSAVNMTLAAFTLDLNVPDPFDATLVKPIVEAVVVVGLITYITVNGKDFIITASSAAVVLFAKTKPGKEGEVSGEEHKKGARKSKKNNHQKGQTRKQQVNRDRKRQSGNWHQNPNKKN